MTASNEVTWFKRNPNGGTVYTRPADPPGEETEPKRKRTRPIINCLRCHRDRQHGGRRLCTSCLILTGQDGTREQYPRTTRRRREDTREDYWFLRGQGMGHCEIAAQLHVTEQYLHELKRGAK